MSRKELFVGNLGKDVNRKDIEDVFDKYGRLVRCDVKNKSFGASFCFLEFEDERDAEDALRGENGKDMDGSSMVVEWAKGKRDFRDSRGGGGDRYGGRDGGRDGGRGEYGGRGGGFGGRDGGRDTSSVECYQCHERGHFARNCPRGGDGGRRDGGRDAGRRDFGGDRRDDDRRGGDRRDDDRRGGDRRDDRRDNSRSRRDSRSKSGGRDRSRTPRRQQSRSPRRQNSRSPSN